MKKNIGTEITAERARWFKLQPQAEDETNADFRSRVAGKLRDMGHVIESHEAQCNRLYNDASGGESNNPMVGIMGAMASQMAGRDYHQSGASRVDDDIAAGTVVRSSDESSQMNPDMLAFALMFGRPLFV